MKIEKRAKTVSIAIDEALAEFDTTIDNIEYEVLQQPSKGFFGIGSKPAKVLIILKEEEKIQKSQQKAEEEKIQKSQAQKQKVQEEEDYGSTKKLISTKIPKMVIDESYVLKSEKDINLLAPEIAIKFLKEIFEKMQIDITIEANINFKNSLDVKLDGEDIGVIIGKRGQTLDALQYLTNLIINKGEFAYMAVNIDTQDYREKRKLALENLAVNLSKKAKKIKREVQLEPMGPYERRIIHAKLQNDPEIKTYSKDEEPFRYVVIVPKK